MTPSASEAVARPMTYPMEEVVKGLLAKARRWHRQRRDLKEARAAFMHTVYLEDRLLDDMGVTREEVLWAASLPIEVNAAQALRERAVKRRAAQVCPSLGAMTGSVGRCGAKSHSDVN